jgi:hypothetical protein
MAKEKFFFIFGENPNQRVFIDEPVGYTGAPFILQRQDDGMGLDVSLNGDENSFTLTDQRDHQLPEMVYYRDRYGFEANVLFGIIFEDGTELINQVDFQTSKTDDYSYFEFSCITVSSEQVFKRQMKTKVDMFSSLGINGEFIEPLAPINMLLQAKPSIQTSKWEQITPTISYGVLGPGTFFNITQGLIQFDIKNSFVPFLNSSQTRSDMQIIEADTNLKNVVIHLDNIDIDFGAVGLNSTTIALRYFKETPSGNTSYLIHQQETINLVSNLSGAFTAEVGDMQRGDKLYLYLFADSNTVPFVNVKKINTTITSTSTAYNSITPCFRLIDVMKQIAKSTAGLEVTAPRYNVGGEFYDTVLTNGKMLGGNITDPFYISWEDLIESVKGEGHGGFEISLDGKVFVGIEDDFYTNVECGVFEDIQFDSLVKDTDPKMALNTFKLNFSNYQSLKENTEPNSGSTIHGETILTLPNTEVEGTLEVKIPWIRDAILLDVQQRLSTVVSKDTATQDDDKIFAIDTIETENDQQFTESTELQHTDNGGFLSLKSDGSVNFLVLGIKTGTTFQILYPDPNAGSYMVSAVFNTELQLFGGSYAPANNGVRLTKYTYEIKVDTIPLTNRTNEGFVSVENLISPDKYSNLRYSVERIIRKRWEKFLAGCVLWKDGKKIINTYYKNNGACITNYDGLIIQEKENFTPAVDPIYTSNWYEGITFANVDFEEFVALCNKLRRYHGYITMKDINRRVLQIYPEKLSYQNDTRAIVIDGNEKFIKAYMTITNEGGNIVVNDETIVTVLKWDMIDRKVELFDLERQRLYQGVFFYKVSINGSVTKVLSEFIDRMNLIGEKFDSTKF